MAVVTTTKLAAIAVRLILVVAVVTMFQLYSISKLNTRVLFFSNKPLVFLQN
jgi:hypothetical protein